MKLKAALQAAQKAANNIQLPVYVFNGRQIHNIDLVKGDDTEYYFIGTVVYKSTDVYTAVSNRA